MRTRLKDIAHELNISAGLVSGVLNGRDNVWASEETRKRIFDAAKRLNYSSTAIVKEKAGPTPERFEIVICRDDGDTWSESSVVWEALRCEAERPLSNWVVSSFGDIQSALDYLASGVRTDPLVLGGSVDGVERMARALEAKNVPFVVLGRHEGYVESWPLCCVALDEMIRGAIDHIRVQGHRRIAYLGRSADSAGQRLMTQCFVKWINSVLAVSNAESLVVACRDDLEENRIVIDRLLDLPENERPTGFVVTGGIDAWHALELCLHRRGRRLGYAKGMPSASGIFDRSIRLLFGDALGYNMSDQSVLMVSALRRMYAALKAGETPAWSNQGAPRLTRISSLHLDLTADLRNPREELH